jgi:tetratricopeptide (TPR) repeat protein
MKTEINLNGLKNFIPPGNVKEDACAYNMLGFLLERQQVYRGAAQAFEMALQLLETDEDSSLRDMVLNNHGRVLVHLQQYEAAICQYLKIKKADFIAQCGLSIAYFKGREYDVIDMETSVILGSSSV